ncbi:MAG: hypothetical protein ABIN24_13880, partial [Dyadobacter sp.]
MKRKFLLFTFFVFYLSLSSHSQSVNWREIYPGVWKGVVGKPDVYNLLNAADVQPSPTLQKLQKSTFPLNNADIVVEV